MRTLVLSISVILILVAAFSLLLSLQVQEYKETLEVEVFRGIFPASQSELITHLEDLESLSGNQKEFLRNSDMYYSELGLTQAYLEEYSDAIQSFSEVFFESENSELIANTHYNMGVIFLKLSQKVFTPDALFERLLIAKIHFESALRENPDHEDSRFNLEKLYRLFEEIGVPGQSEDPTTGDGSAPGFDDRDY